MEGRPESERPAIRRARDQAAKDARRDEILRAAAALFSERSYSELTMALVAQRAGLAKGTVYLYFRTKEEMFLHLVLELLSEWFAALEGEIEALGRKAAPEDFGRVVAKTLARRQDLTRLLCLLHTILEQNVDVDEATAFKRRLLALMTSAAGHLERTIPGFPPGEGIRFLRWLHALTVGLCQSATPAPAVAAALEAPDLAPFRVDFEAELARAVTVLLRGALAQSGRM